MPSSRLTRDGDGRRTAHLCTKNALREGSRQRSGVLDEQLPRAAQSRRLASAVLRTRTTAQPRFMNAYADA
ncbi:hypothetical protein [Streptomyces sp. NPDC054786]